MADSDATLSLKSNVTTAFLMALSLTAASSSFSAFAAESADNSARNQRDTHSKTLVPSDQSKGTDLDVEVTRQIRALIVKENDFSVKAQNVKIITLNGVVTLRGPVANLSEKNRIETLAKSATATSKSGAYKIKNDLEVIQ